MAGGRTFRHICFTLNNPESDEIDFCQSQTLRYAVWQRESDKNGTPHLQGYLEFSKNVSMKAVKEIIVKDAHLAERRGTREEARGYCMKAESRVAGPWEYGTWIAGSGH